MQANENCIEGERIVCVFPCIGGDSPLNWKTVDSAVITYDEDERFTVYPIVKPNGDIPYPATHFKTFPAAIRFARQQKGWG